ncbi:MAG: hypothetical protein ABJF11_07095 [Reichenbachiella sp.]|uniref:hypothetical protein n=1 Tax=Reichenbachiella sp. TaxID=2184521 RepID=UPI003264F393
MRNILITLILIAISISVQAQDFVFHYNEMERDELMQKVATTEHPFGSEFTQLMLLLKENYTSEEQNSISLTMTLTVEKPSIYYSVRKANKHYIKAARKGRIPKEEAKKGLQDVLVKALNIRYQNTEALEDKLDKIKDVEEIVAFYSKDVKLDM